MERSPRKEDQRKVHIFQQGFLHTPLVTKKLYVSVHAKFLLALLGATLWAWFSIRVAQPWYTDLSANIGPVPACLLIAAVAIIPGFMNAFLMVSLMLDRRPPHQPLSRYPSLSILIAAYNEAESIAETLSSIQAQQYPGQLQVIVIDDGSSDKTAAIVESHFPDYPWLQLIRQEQNGGKAKALNAGLKVSQHELVVTIDADSYLYRDALTSIVERFLQDPPSTRAVAGCVLVRNSRLNWITEAQEWDYFHGIATIKRVQSLFQGTLVAMPWK